MTFEWDDRKAAQNITKHGVPFEYAVRVFLDPHRLDSEDIRRDFNEERRLTSARSKGDFLRSPIPRAVKVIRVISARKANEREQRQYDETLST
jgi:uncharacterized DUF497 family protein